MIDIESELFNKLATNIRENFQGTFVTGEYVPVPPSFPAVSIVEENNEVYRNARSNDYIENFAQVMYEVNVYSNKQNGKKSECKSIIQLIDTQLLNLGFTRIMLRHVPNEDVSIHRMTARYRALVSKDKVIYRR